MKKKTGIPATIYPGMLIPGGSTATSREEQLLRAKLHSSLSFLPAGIRVKCHNFPIHTPRLLTPDMISMRYKLIIEYDGHKWHRDEKLKEDLLRGYLFEKTGFRVIRFRVNNRVLTENDIFLTAGVTEDYLMKFPDAVSRWSCLCKSAKCGVYGKYRDSLLKWFS